MLRLKLNHVSKRGPCALFTKWLNVLPPNFLKVRSRKIACYDDRIALKFDRHHGSAACCRGACQISERLENYKPESRGLMTSWNFLVRLLRLVNRGPGNHPNVTEATLGLYSLSGKTSYRQISWSHEDARLDVAMVVSLWNLTGTSAAALPRYLSNFRAVGKV